MLACMLLLACALGVAQTKPTDTVVSLKFNEEQIKALGTEELAGMAAFFADSEVEVHSQDDLVILSLKAGGKKLGDIALQQKEEGVLLTSSLLEEKGILIPVEMLKEIMGNTETASSQIASLNFSMDNTTAALTANSKYEQISVDDLHWETVGAVAPVNAVQMSITTEGLDKIVDALGADFKAANFPFEMLQMKDKDGNTMDAETFVASLKEFLRDNQPEKEPLLVIQMGMDEKGEMVHASANANVRVEKKLKAAEGEEAKTVKASVLDYAVYNVMTSEEDESRYWDVIVGQQLTEDSEDLDTDTHYVEFAFYPEDKSCYMEFGTVKDDNYTATLSASAEYTAAEDGKSSSLLVSVNSVNGDEETEIVSVKGTVTAKDNGMTIVGDVCINGSTDPFVTLNVELRECEKVDAPVAAQVINAEELKNEEKRNELTESVVRLLMIQLLSGAVEEVPAA